MKIHPVEDVLFHAGRQMDGHDKAKLFFAILRTCLKTQFHRSMNLVKSKKYNI